MHVHRILMFTPNEDTHQLFVFDANDWPAGMADFAQQADMRPCRADGGRNAVQCQRPGGGGGYGGAGATWFGFTLLALPGADCAAGVSDQTH